MERDQRRLRFLSARELAVPSEHRLVGDAVKAISPDLVPRGQVVWNRVSSGGFWELGVKCRVEHGDVRHLMAERGTARPYAGEIGTVVKRRERLQFFERGIDPGVDADRAYVARATVHDPMTDGVDPQARAAHPL